jgi:hypothetical protein
MISPLQYDQFNRETWGDFDSAVMAQLASLAYDPCYKPKLYKAPDSSSEVVANGGYVSYVLSITPGALIVGYYALNAAGWMVQVWDLDLDVPFFSDPIPIAFLANTQKSAGFPNLRPAVRAVVGSGRFRVELWNNSGRSLRLQLVLGVLEPQ